MLALEGIRIVDLTRLLPGPYCTLLLADMGAEVIRVEDPASGDATRTSGPFIAGVGAVHLLLNRNKRSLALNLKAPEGREIFVNLVRTADVVVEGFRPGVMDRLGLGYAVLKEVNPRIVFCSLSGFGQDGPYRSRVGHDANYMAIAGLLKLVGDVEEAPTLPGIQIADMAGGVHAALGILAALVARGTSGRGQFVDVAMLDGVMTWMVMQVAHLAAKGEEQPREKMYLAGTIPSYNVYETRDHKYVTVGALEPHFWANLCRALGREDLIKLAGATGAEGTMLQQEMKEIFSSKTSQEWEEELGELDICFGPVNGLAEAQQDPQVRHREILIEVDDPRCGPVLQFGFPIKFSNTPCSVRTPAPGLGEHTQSVLAELGYKAEEIEGLRAKGVVGM